MANQYKGENEIRLRLPDEIITLLEQREGYVHKKRGIASGPSHEIRKIVYEALGVEFVDQHEKQSEMFSKAKKAKKNSPPKKGRDKSD